MFLRGFDKSLREFVKQELEKSGIDLKFNTRVKEIRSTDDKDTNSKYQISLEDGGILNADLVMYATAETENGQFRFRESRNRTRRKWKNCSTSFTKPQ